MEQSATDTVSKLDAGVRGRVWAGLFLPRPVAWAYGWLSAPFPHGVVLCLPVSWSPPLSQAPVLWDQDTTPATTVTSFSLHHLCKDRISKRGPVPRCGVQGFNIHIWGTHRAPAFSRRHGHCFTCGTGLVSISRFSLSCFLEVQLYQLDFQVGRLKLREEEETCP